MEISGKTAIVTGAASGIGLGIATALAEAGANVVMADIQQDVVTGRSSSVRTTKQASRQDLRHPGAVGDRCARRRRSAASASRYRPEQRRCARCTALSWWMCRWPTGHSSSASMLGVIHWQLHFVPVILKHGEAGHVVPTPPRSPPRRIAAARIRGRIR